MTSKPIIALLVTLYLIPVLFIGFCIGFVTGETLGPSFKECVIAVRPAEQYYGTDPRALGRLPRMDY